MATLENLHVVIVGGDAAKESVAALIAAIDSLGDSRVDSFGSRLMALHEDSDIGFVESAGNSTRGATILDALKYQPTDRYRELASAVADDIDGCSIRVVHEWPVLRVVSAPILPASPAESSGDGA